MSARYPEPDPADPWAAPRFQPGYSSQPGAGTEWGTAGASGPDWGMPSYPPFAGRPPIATSRDVLAALGVVVLSLAVGVAVAYGWLAFAPKLELVVRGDTAVPVGLEGEALVGLDGTFAMLAAGAGVLCAVIAFLWQRRRSIGVVIGLAAGGAAAAQLAAYLGGLIGPAALSMHRGDPDGAVFTHPLELRATGVILLWPIAALLVYLALTLLFDHDERRRGDGGWYTRPG